MTVSISRDGCPGRRPRAVHVHGTELDSGGARISRVLDTRVTEMSLFRRNLPDGSCDGCFDLILLFARSRTFGVPHRAHGSGGRRKLPALG